MPAPSAASAVISTIAPRVLPDDQPLPSRRRNSGRQSLQRNQATLATFAETEPEAVTRFRRSVAEGKGQPSTWEQLKQQVFLGSDAFVDAIQGKISKERDLREVPQARRRPVARPLAEYAQEHQDRDRALAAAYASGAYSMRQIAGFFGLHLSRITKIVRAAEVAGGDHTRSEATEKT